MANYGITDVRQEPVYLTFREGREYGWSFEVTEDIKVTALGFFNVDVVPVSRSVFLYKNNECICTKFFDADADSMGFSEIEELILGQGKYMITVKIPHGANASFAQSENVEFGSEGISYIEGIFQNINDVGWLKTSNCYLVNFEYELLSN